MTPAADLMGEELEAVRGDIDKADTKCGILAGLSGAALAALITQLHAPIPVRVVFGAAGLTLAAAIGVLLAVLRPRFGSGGFCRYARMDGPTDIWDLFIRVSSAQQWRARELHTLSRIAHRKHTWLRRVIHLIGIAVALVVIGGVLAATLT